MTVKEFRINENMETAELRELRTQRLELEQRADQLLEEKKPKEVMDVISEIKSLDKRIKALEEEIYTKEGETRMKPSPFAPQINNAKQQSKEYRDFKHYLETKELRADIKTDTGAAVVPEEVVTDIEEIRDQVTTLSDFVNVVKVEHGSGKIPVLKQDIPALPQVPELQQNPELAMAPYTPISYDIVTHRGFLRLSQEVVEDNRSNLVDLVTQYLGRSVIATENQAILNQLNQLEVIDAVGIDGIKTALNTKLLPNYVNNVIIVNSTIFNKLDLLKDKNGRYLLQDRVGDAPGKAINGVPVHVVSDKELPGTNIVIGSLKDTVTLFRRSQYNLQWTDYMHFGQGFMVAIRQDCQLMNKEAAYLLNFSVESETVPTA